MIKKTLKSILLKLIKNNFCWFVLDKLILRFARYIDWLKQQQCEQEQQYQVNKIIKKLFPSLEVRHGIFKGMKYPKAASTGSELFPKLLGSYESELNGVFTRILEEEFSEIIDIGCAEGYYAVGLALRYPKAKIYAYDINDAAQKLCHELAVFNGVSGQINIEGFCDASILASIRFNGKGLIISDCEGWEIELFNEKIIGKYANNYFLIEVHDSFNIEISTVLKKRFSKTHTLEIIQSVDDIKKAQSYDYEELNEFNLQIRKLLLQEKRANIMEWFYFKPKTFSCSDKIS